MALISTVPVDGAAAVVSGAAEESAGAAAVVDGAPAEVSVADAVVVTVSPSPQPAKTVAAANRIRIAMMESRFIRVSPLWVLLCL